MALRVLMQKKRLDEKKKELEEIRTQLADFSVRESELEKAIEEALTEEEKSVVEEEVEKFENEKAEAEEKEKTLASEVDDLEKGLVEMEAEQEKEPEPIEPKEEERKVNVKMETRKFFKMNAQERDQFFAREDVQNYLGEVRSAIKEKRALTNVGLTIPEVFMGLIKENLIDYSKLYKHVDVRAISGEGRMAIMGTIPEAVWKKVKVTIQQC